MAILLTLVSFNGTDGNDPEAGLIADANGDLFGTTVQGGSVSGISGAAPYGTVFEIAKASTGYASTPTTLVTFGGQPIGAYPAGSLIADANGDFFGTTQLGGLLNLGSVFEVAKTPTGYRQVGAFLASFSGNGGSYPQGSLIADAAGDLFGTTPSGGAYRDGTVFEIAKTPTGYAGGPTTLVSFNGANGSYPYSSLIADSAGDLFGTTYTGGAYGDGTVFEIAKTAAGFASTPTTLVSFNGADGQYVYAGLIADGAGDLFGTTGSGGAYGDGTVFEIAKTAAGFASTPTTLVSFNGADGAYPDASLIADANGDLFGTTSGVDSNGNTITDGTVFEIKRTAAGFASVPITLVSFNGDNGKTPYASLIADASGHLFGTTYLGGANGDGTVFEITDSGFVTGASVASGGIVWRNASTGAVELWSPNGSGGFTYEALSPVSTSWQIAGTGDFTGGGEDGILWRNASTGGVELWNPNGSGGFTYEALNAVNMSWQVAGTGDFTGGGDDGILWRNASTGGVEL